MVCPPYHPSSFVCAFSEQLHTFCSFLLQCQQYIFIHHLPHYTMMVTRSTTADQASPLTPPSSTAKRAGKKAPKKTTDKAVLGTSSRVSKSSKKRARVATPAQSPSESTTYSSASNSPLTLRPTVIEDTPPPSSLDEIARLKREVPHLKRSQNKRSKSRRSRYDSDSSATDSEAADTPRVSFLHQEAQPLAEIARHPSAPASRDPSESWYKQTSLPREAARLLWWGLAVNTRRNYQTSFKMYAYHAIGNGFNPPYPATLQSLASWISWLVNRVKTDTISNHMKGVRSVHVDLGYEDMDHVFQHPQLKRMMTGARRLRGEAVRSFLAHIQHER